MPRRSLLLLSNSRNADGAFLEHAQDALAQQLASVRVVCFVPYAGVTVTPDAYTERVRAAFRTFGVTVRGVHEGASPTDVVAESDGIVVGGGNTFRLLQQLQQQALLDPIRVRVASGVPYVGWSAGSVVACPTIGTTNDMPIVAPDGFRALGLVDFQINPHFTDAHPPGFRGETRRERLAEYGVVNPQARVVGLPEGNWLEVQDASIALHGPHATPWFSMQEEGTLRPDGAVAAVLEPNGLPAIFR